MRKIVSVLVISVLLSLMFVSGLVSADSSTYLKATLLNQDPDPANPGEYVELRWKVEKFGDDTLSDITFTLDLDYPFSFDSIDTAQKTIGDWSGYSDDDEFYILYYKVFVAKNAIKDDYDVSLQIDTDKFSMTKEDTIRVGDADEVSFAVGQLLTSPLKLYADSDENKLEVTLENIGDSAAEVVTVDLVLPEGFSETYGYSARANLGTISEGSNKVATFYVDIDEGVSEGPIEAFIKVQYTDASDDEVMYYSKELPLTIPISGRPEFTIGKPVFSPVEFYPGDTVTMTVEVTNVGSKEAESVSLRAFKESSQPFSFEEKSDFVGKLEPGQSGFAVLSFTVDDDAITKEFIVDMQARGIYNEEVLVDDGVVAISVAENPRSAPAIFSAKISLLLALLVVIVVGFLAYRTGASAHRR